MVVDLLTRDPERSIAGRVGGRSCLSLSVFKKPEENKRSECKNIIRIISFEKKNFINIGTTVSGRTFIHIYIYQLWVQFL